MNILVCIKQVPDDFAKIALNSDGVPALDGISTIVNAFDTYAVEMAVRYVETNGGKVTVLTLGEEKTVRPAVVQMISVGANSGYIASYDGSGDELTVAKVLAQAVKNIEEKEGCCLLI